MSMILQGYLNSLALSHLAQATGPFAQYHTKRMQELQSMSSAAGPLLVKPEEHETFARELAEAMTNLRTTHAAINNDGFQWSISGDLLAIPGWVKDRIASANVVILRINSGGGDAGAALQLLDCLDGKQVLTEAVYAGSAAALVTVCSPGRRTIAANGGIMLHRPWSFSMGDSFAMHRFGDWLENITEKWLDRIVTRTEQPRDEVSKWFVPSQSVHFTPEQALVLNLVDAIAPAAPEVAS